MIHKSDPARLILLPCLWLVAAALLSGCVTLRDPEASQVQRADTVAILDAGVVVEQSVMSRRARMNGLNVWLRPQEGAGGTIRIDVYPEGGEAPLVSRSVPVRDFPGNELAISFPPLEDPPGSGYRLRLAAEDGPIAVLGRGEDLYPHGAASVNNVPAEADLAFRLSYEYGPGAVLEDLWRALGALPAAIPLLLVVWLPGWLILEASGLSREFDWGERTAAAVGLSGAALAVLLVWTTAFGIAWSRAGVWVLAGGLALAGGWRLYRSLRRRLVERPVMLFRPGSFATAAALAGVFVLALGVRLAMVRDLAAPPWVDSVHHGMIARMIADSGRLPASYAPYISTDLSQYHSGFHVQLAFFHWLSGLGMDTGLLVLGQVLNALMVFAVYLFTTTLIRSRTAGIAAALIAGLLTPMPAYYTSWGRYTQLAGLLVLPTALAFALRLIDARAGEGKRLRWLAGLTGVAGGGLFLIHYRVVVFLALLLLAVLVARAWNYTRQRGLLRPYLQDISRLAGAGAAGVLVTLPWWPAAVSDMFLPKLVWRNIQAELFGDFSWSFLNPVYGSAMLRLAGVGLGVGLLRRRRFPVILALWVALMFLVANLAVWNLPGGGLINNTSVTIALFMPIAAAGGSLVGWAAGVLRRFLPAWVRPEFNAALLIGGLAAGLLGARAMLPLLNAQTFLFREGDRPAMAWIHDNLPADETVLVNPFAWGYGLYAGQDGGYWISSLAGHPTFPPPVIYGVGNDIEEIRRVTELSRRITEAGKDPDELHALLLENGIEYVYTGVRGGAIYSRALAESPLFEALYAGEGAWVFRVLPGE